MKGLKNSINKKGVDIVHTFCHSSHQLKLTMDSRGNHCHRRYLTRCQIQGEIVRIPLMHHFHP
jgi:hypothetical protein